MAPGGLSSLKDLLQEPTMPVAEDQIQIPSELPEMLKQFTIDAINTQPPDLLEWSYKYFNALKNGEKLPNEESKKRHSISKWVVLTPEILKELHRKTIAKTLKLVCEVLSDGASGPPRITFSTFQFLYSFLAAVDGEVSEQQVHQMLNYLEHHVIGPDGTINISEFTENPNVMLE
ncbi:ropporin-1-like isoform X3 [Hyla sarda]|uniref:ropporin-1-like isoform X3 n=1 Tax=Hyla sarda TaxID=327740 RepID=UPI0024C38EFA|nr:ropporin-1-like isoform X3 [Hyla sarda]